MFGFLQGLSPLIGVIEVIELDFSTVFLLLVPFRALLLELSDK